MFLVPLIISYPFFWTNISCLFIVVVNTSSHKTPNGINGSVLIFGEMYICLTCFLRPGSWSVVICEDSIVIPYGSLSVILFGIVTGACFDRFIFAPNSDIDSILLLGLKIGSCQVKQSIQRVQSVDTNKVDVVAVAGLVTDR